jgi:adenylate kinase
MILMLGTPGAGKTTQSQLLSEHLGCKWFSMGELIRDYSSGQARQDMMSGKIIDDKVTLDIVDKVLDDSDTAHQEVIFEGNPRSIAQAQWWIDQQARGRLKITGVLHLIAKKSVAHDRIVHRGRADDISEKVINQRFAEYDRSITPTVSYLKEHGVSVHDIDANGSIEEVAQAIRSSLGV